jgi:hypothetical protein
MYLGLERANGESKLKIEAIPVEKKREALRVGPKG